MYCSNAYARESITFAVDLWKILCRLLPVAWNPSVAQQHLQRALSFDWKHFFTTRTFKPSPWFQRLFFSTMFGLAMARQDYTTTLLYVLSDVNSVAASVVSVNSDIRAGLRVSGLWSLSQTYTRRRPYDIQCWYVWTQYRLHRNSGLCARVLQCSL